MNDSNGSPRSQRLPIWLADSFPPCLEEGDELLLLLLLEKMKKDGISIHSILSVIVMGWAKICIQLKNMELELESLPHQHHLFQFNLISSYLFRSLYFSFAGTSSIEHFTETLLCYQIQICDCSIPVRWACSFRPIGWFPTRHRTLGSFFGCCNNRDKTFNTVTYDIKKK